MSGELWKTHCIITGERVHTQRWCYDAVEKVSTPPHDVFRMNSFFSKFDNCMMQTILLVRENTSKTRQWSGTCSRWKWGNVYHWSPLTIRGAKYEGQLKLKHSITTKGSSPVDNVSCRKPNHLLNDVQETSAEILITADVISLSPEWTRTSLPRAYFTGNGYAACP